MATDPPQVPKRPTGRDEIVASLVAAARDLFAERGIERVTVREIASRANVNPGLLHRHFENKEALIAASFAEDAAAARLSLEVQTPSKAAEQLFIAAVTRPAFVKILASALLGAVDVATVLPPDGPLRKYLQVLREARPDDDITTDFLLTAAAGLGWAFFGPALEFLADVDPADHDKIERRISERLQAIASGELVDD